MTFDHAAQICRAVDCLIAATCLENGTDLYQNDRDFVIISTGEGYSFQTFARVSRL